MEDYNSVCSAGADTIPLTALESLALSPFLPFTCLRPPVRLSACSVVRPIDLHGAACLGRSSGRPTFTPASLKALLIKSLLVSLWNPTERQGK